MFFEPFLSGLQDPGVSQVPYTHQRGTSGPSQAANNQADPVKKKTPNSSMALVGEAIAWPVYLSKREETAPLIVFAGGTFFGIPLVMPGTTVGATLLTGYAVASLVYYIQNFGYPPVHQLEGNPSV
jgi:hypothetical protein